MLIQNRSRGLPRAFPTASRVAGRERGCVHRTGARPADRLDDDAPILEQAIEHAPGERAVRAPALKREADLPCN